MRAFGLTLTWDVLKFNSPLIISECSLSININMRCIEMCLKMDLPITVARININMRCIEITLKMCLLNLTSRLTLTWDVLKLHHPGCLACITLD